MIDMEGWKFVSIEAEGSEGDVRPRVGKPVYIDRSTVVGPDV